MKTEAEELLDYNDKIDPIEGDEETTDPYTDEDEDTEAEDDARAIAVGNDVNEPDPESKDYDPTEEFVEDEDLTDDDE